jgi:hypothetical protein
VPDRWEHALLRRLGHEWDELLTRSKVPCISIEGSFAQRRVQAGVQKQILMRSLQPWACSQVKVLPRQWMVGPRKLGQRGLAQEAGNVKQQSGIIGLTPCSSAGRWWPGQSHLTGPG